MTMIEAFKAEFEQEAPVTKKMLELIPDSEWNWKPHEKSMTIGKLGTHIAEIPHWAADIINRSEFDMIPAEHKPTVCNNHAEAVAMFEKNMKSAIQAMGIQSDAYMMEPWTFKNQGKPVFTMPRISTLRAMFLNHVIHHRGQLSVFLRLKNVPLPSVYGPTADTGKM